MPATPARAGKTAKRGSLFLSEVVAKNIRGYRALAGLTQDDLARRLVQLDHGWVRATVSEVERNGRIVGVDELAGLAAVLEVTVAALLDPAGPERVVQPLDVGGQRVLPPPLASKFVNELPPDEQTRKHVAACVRLKD